MKIWLNFPRLPIYQSRNLIFFHKDFNIRQVFLVLGDSIVKNELLDVSRNIRIHSTVVDFLV